MCSSMWGGVGGVGELWEGESKILDNVVHVLLR